MSEKNIVRTQNIRMSPSLTVYMGVLILFGRVILGFYDELSDWIYYFTIEFQSTQIKDIYVFFLFA